MREFNTDAWGELWPAGVQSSPVKLWSSDKKRKKKTPFYPLVSWR